MRKACLPICLLLLSGCWQRYYDHEAMVTLKEGVPCFAPVSDDKARKEEAEIYSIMLARYPVIIQEGSFPFTGTWSEGWKPSILLSGDECILYGGDSPLEKNTFYGVSFSAGVPGRMAPEIHGYGKVFCLSEGKDGETIIHQFSDKDIPESCPP
ncbi:MAG: hypothetical protein LBF61_08260 [Azoarcus sp.]|jgi:hypothetical protein|nr:hypothetical protein [Azoarcus sp.]